ncbi:MAG TPA: hypothetical protein VF677_05550 [Flavobacterium sp.]
MTSNSFFTIPLSSQLAIASFVLGTLLFGNYLLFPNQLILISIGIYYLLSAIIVNSIMLLWLIYNCFLKPYRLKQISIEILVLLANIPVAMLYFFILISLEY